MRRARRAGSRQASDDTGVECLDLLPNVSELRAAAQWHSSGWTQGVQVLVRMRFRCAQSMCASAACKRIRCGLTAIYLLSPCSVLQVDP
jgi:hypothetical protein